MVQKRSALNLLKSKEVNIENFGFTDPLHSEGIRLLKNANFEVIDGTNASTEKISLSRDVDAWLIRSGTNINKKAIDRAQKLKITGRAGVGVDNIDIEFEKKEGLLSQIRQTLIQLPCEHTIALMLSRSEIFHLASIY